MTLGRDNWKGVLDDGVGAGERAMDAVAKPSTSIESVVPNTVVEIWAAVAVVVIVVVAAAVVASSVASVDIVLSVYSVD